MKAALLPLEMTGMKQGKILNHVVYVDNLIFFLTSLSYLVSIFFCRMERSLNQTLRAQQDQAYEDSLQADREKERLRRLERERREEEERQRRESEHQEQLEREVSLY